MAQLAPFGFQAGQSRRSVNEYYVAASDTSTLAVGDPVKTDGNIFVGRLPDSRVSKGMLHVTKAAPGQAIRGVIVGIVAGPGDNSLQSLPATKTRPYCVLVNDNPQALWDVQADNAAPLSAMAGMYASYAVGAPLGSVSSTVVDADSIGSTVSDLLIAEALRNDGANSLLRVAFVQHEMAAAGGSPQIGGALQSLVSGARNVGGMSPYLARRKQTVLECWAGKVKSVAHAADYCTRVFRTLECHADRIRIGIINPLTVDLVNVRVSVGTSDTMPADLASLHGSTTAEGAILSNGGLTSSAAFTAAAGTNVNAPTITWSPWLDFSTVDRADGGTLPAVRITIEIPFAGNGAGDGAGRGFRPAYDTSTTRSGWESQGSATVAPYGRCYKARNGAGLGVTSPAAGSSTTWSDETIPFVLEYVPRDGVVPVSLTVYGDSIVEGVGATLEGHGWPFEARAQLSTMSAPMGVCNMAMAGATQANYADRVDAVAAALASDAAILAMFTPNGITAPNFTAASTAPAQRRANQRARATLAAQDALVIGFSGIPMEAAFKDLDATSVGVLNNFIAGVRNGNMPVIDAWGAMAGTADADGQVNCLAGTLADGVHPNTVGYRDRIAPVVVSTLRQFLIAPAG